MYLTRKHLSRRTVIKGAGAAVGLPLLDAMIPAATALAQTAAAPKLRVGFFYFPHGAVLWNTPHGPEMDHWTPSGAGADFVATLAATPDGEGTLLDRSMLMYGSNMANSDLHNNYPIPNILVGGGAGALKRGGQQIELPERTPVANLLLTVLNKAGLAMESFGDSSGEIAGV